MNVKKNTSLGLQIKVERNGKTGPLLCILPKGKLGHTNSIALKNKETMLTLTFFKRHSHSVFAYPLKNILCLVLQACPAPIEVSFEMAGIC